jgi:NitT/TauT family transport system ATP-binding protein
VITIEAVSKRFGNGTQALDAVSARIDTGDFVALLGPSGCGKSTLLRLLAGLEEPSAGRVEWDTGRQPGPGTIGFVFQDATLLPWATAAENVWLPLRLRSKTRSDSAASVAAALTQVGLADFADAKPRRLSGGMKMRVSIARALVSNPNLLLMDEPFAALDEFTRHRLQEDLRHLWQQTGKTVVFVTHSIYEAAYLASRIFLMSARPGRIATEITAEVPDQVDRRTSPEYTALIKQVTDAFRAISPG